jgi:type II secretory pathway pseudopilin PulG
MDTSLEPKGVFEAKANDRAFTLTEVLISSAIAALTIAGIITGYVQTAKRAEWTGYSLAAHSAALQIIERARAAKWDPAADPAVDFMVNSEFPTSVVIMDVPVSGTNMVYVTNTINITMASVSPPVKMIRVDATWQHVNGKVYTNTLVSYRSPKT